MSALTLSDDELVAHTVAGDNSAFAELWKRHSAAAYTVARGYRSLDADDLVAEAFARTYRAMVHGAGPTSAFRAYVFTTIRNLATRVLAKDSALSLDGDLNVDTLDELATAGVDLEGVATASRAFAALPERWQHVLWIIGVEGHTVTEAAAMLDISPNAVSARVSRARHGFRRELIIAHCADLDDDSVCRRELSAYLESSSPRDIQGADADNLLDDSRHLRQCNRCRAIIGDRGSIDGSLAVVMVVMFAGGLAIPVAASNLTSTLAAQSAPAAGHSSRVFMSLVAVTIAGAVATAAIATTAALSTLSAPPTGLIAGPDSKRDVPEPPVKPTETDNSTETDDSTEPTADGNAGSTTPPPRPNPVPAPPSGGGDGPDGDGDGTGDDDDDDTTSPLTFAVFATTSPYYGEVTGSAMPGWTIEAFVSNAIPGIDPGPAPDPDLDPDPDPVCGDTTDPPAGTMRYSTVADDSGSWSLIFDGAPAGTYTVIAQQCRVVDGVVERSAKTVASTFTVEPPPAVELELVGGVYFATVTGLAGHNVLARTILGEHEYALDDSGTAGFLAHSADPEVRYVDGHRVGPPAAITIIG